MVIGAVDQRDAHLGVAQGLGRGESCKAGTQNHDMRMFSLQHAPTVRGEKERQIANRLPSITLCTRGRSSCLRVGQ